MNAKLDPWLLAERIAQKPVTRPDYTPALNVSYPKWVAINDIDLCDYFNALGTYDGSYAEFCACQYDVQVEQDEEEAEYVESGEYARDEAAEPSDACDE